MSLLTAVNQSSAGQDYFVANISTTPAYPVIAAPVGDVVIQSVNGQANLTADGGTGNILKLGANQNSFQNVILSDNLTTVATSLVLAGDISVGGGMDVSGNLAVTNGDVVLVNGDIDLGGGTLTGWQQTNVPPIVVPNSGAPQAIANPTTGPGLYAFTVTYTTAGNDAIALSNVAYFTGSVWYGGSAVSAAGPGSAVISPNAGATALQIAQSGGGAVTANVIFYKVLGPSV
jgi:hypothetical protein